MSFDQGRRRGSTQSGNSNSSNLSEASREALQYIGEPRFASEEKLNQALIGQPFSTGSSPSGGEAIIPKGLNYQLTAENTDALIPRAEGYIGEPEPLHAMEEKKMQSLFGAPFLTGTDPANGPIGSGSYERKGDPVLASGTLKDGEDGVKPVALGGHYSAPVERPREDKAESFDEAHGHKTDIPWSSGAGSGFDLDWQYEDQKGTATNRVRPA